MVYRPPSEAYSLIIQVTIGCSQNDCIFCSMYKAKEFRVRPMEDILLDFDMARETYASVRKIFLADGDALMCKTEDLIQILKYIKDKFPECQQVTTYASPRSVLVKDVEELKQLQQHGLSMVYMGLESGNEKVLEYMKKKATKEEIIEAANRIHEARIKLSVTAISGLGGRSLWKEHAVDTGKVFSEMKPEYAALLTLMVEEGTPLKQKVETGEFELLSAYDILFETKLLLEHFQSPGTVFRSNHASNYVNLAGTLDDDTPRLLAQLDEAIEGNIALKSEWMRGL